jgi:hypothetical protein
MSNKDIFMTITIIHSLQGFHIYYGMYVMVRGLGFFCCSFPYFAGFPNRSGKIKGGNLRKIILENKTKFPS